MRTMGRLLVGAGVAAVLVIGSVTTTPGDAAGEDDVPRAPTQEALGAESEVAAVNAPATERLVNVYWGWTMPSHPISPERVAAGARYVDAMTPATGALRQLLDGTNAIESNIGMLTTIPAGTTLNGISRSGGAATVDVSSEFEAPGGTLDESMRLAQVVFTLTQFDNIDRVKFRIDGTPTDPILSHGLEVGSGLTRDDFDAIRSLVMVERPFPGARVTNPLQVRGESNTFEANVRYTLTDRGGDGRIIAEGFTTATNGSGTWGTYEFSIDLDALPVYKPGPGAILVWDEDLENGGMGATVEYPIVLPPRCAGKAATILGTPGDDIITGTPGPDVIMTRGGDDRVRAGTGNDIVCLGQGDDFANAQKGRDQVNGGPGHDVVFGMRGADLLLGGDDGDRLHGGPGNDIVDGQDGRDYADGGPGIDVVVGGQGRDSLWGGPDRDLLIGNQGPDSLNGGTGRDELRGGKGADRLDGSSGKDLLKGQHGNDDLNGRANHDHLDGGMGTDRCDGGAGSDTAAHCEVLIRIP